MLRYLLCFLLPINGLFSQTLDSAFYYSEKGEYEQALYYLKAAVNENKPLPDKAAFIHGKIMFHKADYVQAKAGFSKYLDLAGVTAEFSAAAKESLQVCEKLICRKCSNTGSYIGKENCNICDSSGIISVTCNKCTRGIILCPVCKGNKFEKQSTDLGMIYKECTRCGGRGTVSCIHCEGTRHIRKICTTCGGDKKVPVRLFCPH